MAHISTRSLFYFLLYSCSVFFTLSLSVQAKEKAIEILHTHNGGQFKLLFDGFSKQSNIPINTTWMDRNELKTRLLSGGSLAKSPHIIIGPSDIIGLQNLDIALDINKVYSGATPKINSKTLIANKMLPIYKGNHLLMYYNKRYVKKPAETWEELRAIRNRLSPAIDVLAMPMMRMYMFAPFVTSFGEGMVKNGKPNLDTVAVREALRFTWDLEKTGLLDIECDYECSVDKFVSLEAAYSINGIWDYEKLSRLLGKDLGVAPLPKINGKQMQPYGSYFIAIFPMRALHDDERDKLNKIASYLVSDNFQRQVFPVFRELPIQTSALQQADDTVNELVRTFDVAEMFPVLEDPEAFWGAVYKGYVRYGSGAMTAEQASRYMQALATEGL